MTQDERTQHFRRLGLKSRCPVCSKMIGKHCPKRLQVCYETFIAHEGPEPGSRGVNKPLVSRSK